MNKFVCTQKNLIQKKSGALIPFFLIGYPNKSYFLELVDIAVKSGADALELGIPYTDPVADGPTIQNATTELLNSGWKVKDSLELIKMIRERYPNLPIGILVYANLLHSNKELKNYLNHVDSLLVPDLPYNGLDNLELTDSKNIVKVLPPNADMETAKNILNLDSPYTYVTSKSGVTGTSSSLKIDETFNKLVSYKKDMITYLGFGIHTPKQVYEAIKAGFDGVIIGSEIINIINKKEDLGVFIKKCKEMTLKGYQDR